MTDRIKQEIERLLDEPGGADAGQAPSRLRSRLAATFSEGLGGAPSATSGTPDTATMAAFLDGRLSETERERFAADLAGQPGLRADLESAASLVEETSSSKLKVPQHLMAQAVAQFAPAPAPQREAQLDLSSWFAAFLPRPRIAWALVAALVVIVAVPASKMIRDQSGGGEQPELSGVTEPETPQSQKDKACDDKAKEKAKAAKAAGKAEKSGPETAAKDDPCDPSTAKGTGVPK